jgi:hypothetical protein
MEKWKLLNNIKGNGLKHVKQISPKCLPWQAHFHKLTGTCDIGHRSTCLPFDLSTQFLLRKKKIRKQQQKKKKQRKKKIKEETMFLIQKINLIHNSVLTSITLTNNITKRYDLPVPISNIKIM